jgi:hypothetical protein
MGPIIFLTPNPVNFIVVNLEASVKRELGGRMTGRSVSLVRRSEWLFATLENANTIPVLRLQIGC